MNEQINNNTSLLYHITSKENWEQIKKEGLVPSIGSHSLLVGDDCKTIYLAPLKDIRYWNIILGENNVILRVKGIQKGECQEFDYGEYKEYTYNKPIPAENISLAHFTKSNDDEMQDLCLSYIYTISALTTAIARYYNKPGYRTEEEMEYSLKGVLSVISNLDYNICDKKDIRKTIRDAGDGSYSFVDQYLDTNKRLYSQLVKYPEDSLTELRTELYNYIKNTFKPYLYLNTGGWWD